LLLIACTGSVFAQNDMDPSFPGSSLEISGQVRSPDGRKSIEFVQVRLEKTGGGLIDQRTTDSLGRFRFSRLSPGQYVVSAKSPGFTVAPQTVDINRSVPRAFLLLQLVPESSPFANPKTPGPGIVDVNVPPEARKEMGKAQEALANKKTAEGIVHLQKALAIFPEFFDAQMLLGSTYMDDGRLGESHDVLSRAVKINPKSVVAFVSLGELHRRQRKYDDAEKVLLEALGIEDESWVGHYTLGRVYWETNQIVKAGRQIGRTIQLQPDFAEAHLLGGNIFVRLGMAENAIVEYEEYLRLAPGGQQASPTRELVQKLRKSLPERKLSPSKP